MFNYKRLFKDTLIFAIGNLGSKLISFILVPIYTYYLTTSEYGIADLITVTVSMLLPFISFSIYQAVLRYARDKNYSTDQVFNVGLFISLIGIAVSTFVLYPLMHYFNFFGNLSIYFSVILSLQLLESLLGQFVRAIDKVVIFSLNGIIMTITIGLMNILLLAYLNMGVIGYLLSTIIGLIVSILFLFISARVYTYIELKRLDPNLIKDMLNYSLPMIPNTISLQVTNTANRYFILFFIGNSANGLFAVANKIPGLVGMLYSIFYQAWQLSAIDEYESENKSEKYTEVFKYFSGILLIGTSALMTILKPLMNFLVSDDFTGAWQYVPFLMLGTVFSSFSGFLGANYVAAKQTAGVLKTTLLGAIASIVLNLFLIPLIGTNGAGISMMLSYGMIWLIRVKDTKKFVDITLDKTNLLINFTIIIIQIGLLYADINSIYEYLFLSLLFLAILIFNRNSFQPIIRLLLRKRMK